MEPTVIVIDGEIGAGKTTLLHALEEHLKGLGIGVAVVYEPVDEWVDVGILQKFYKNPKKWAYDFQTFTFVTRVKRCIEVREQNPDAQVFLLERSILTDRYIFMELQREMCGPMRMKMYKKWWKMWEKIMPFKPTTFVYLKPSLEKCMERVQIRDRDGEIMENGFGVSEEYQIKLREAHENFFQGTRISKYCDETGPIIIDKELADDDFSIPGEARNKIVERLFTGIII